MCAALRSLLEIYSGGFLWIIMNKCTLNVLKLQGDTQRPSNRSNKKDSNIELARRRWYNLAKLFPHIVQCSTGSNACEHIKFSGFLSSGAILGALYLSHHSNKCFYRVKQEAQDLRDPGAEQSKCPEVSLKTSSVNTMLCYSGKIRLPTAGRFGS